MMSSDLIKRLRYSNNELRRYISHSSKPTWQIHSTVNHGILAWPIGHTGLWGVPFRTYVSPLPSLCPPPPPTLNPPPVIPSNPLSFPHTTPALRRPVCVANRPARPTWAFGLSGRQGMSSTIDLVGSPTKKNKSLEESNFALIGNTGRLNH